MLLPSLNIIIIANGMEHHGVKRKKNAIMDLGSIYENDEISDECSPICKLPVRVIAY